VNRTVRRQFPVFSLYGERVAAAAATDPLHVEDIQSRSRKYLWRIARHRHTGLCQCVYVAAGPVIAELEDTEVRLAGPVVFIIPPGTVHGFAFRAETQGFVLTLDLDRLLAKLSHAQQAPVTRLFSLPRSLVLDGEPALVLRLSQLFDSLHREFSEPDSVLLPVSGWLACSILWMIAAARMDTPSSESRMPGDMNKMRRFRSLVEAHHLNHWPVRRYARELAVSESSLNRLCNSLTGSSAFDLIQQRLALESRRRLIYVAGSVAAVAADLGFKDPAYFCRFFRKHAGMSPSAFRRREAAG